MNDVIVVRASLNASYPIHLLPHRSEHAARLVLATATRGVVVSTPTVRKLYAEAFTAHLNLHGGHFSLVEIDGGEHNKSFATLQALLALFQEHGLSRDDVVVAMGGGVLTDVAGLAASLYLRGVPRVLVPTTLMGQIDAAIGIKTAVNYAQTRNNLGLFNPPSAVLVDPELLATLPPAEIRQGLAEIVKLAIATDAQLFLHVEQLARVPAENLAEAISLDRAFIRQVVSATTALLCEDLFEKSRQNRALDFGHTFSPELESVSQFQIRHGEAVAIDIAVSTQTAAVLGWLSSEGSGRVFDLLDSLHLPRSSPLLSLDLLKQAFARRLRNRGGKIRWPLPNRIGELRYLDHLSEADEAHLAAVLGKPSAGAGRLQREGSRVQSS